MIKSAWDIWCDGGPQCPREDASYSGEYECFDFTKSRADLIARAVSDGWRMGKRRHLCPSCRRREEGELSADERADKELEMDDVPGQLKLGGIEITRQYIVNDELEGARIFRTAIETGDWTHWRGWADASVASAKKRVAERLICSGREAPS